jgi:endonuclease/exonuclease/phosphatase family metal-dependent hydrolase
MTTSTGRTPARRRAAALGLCASILAATATLAPGSGAIAGPPTPHAAAPVAATHSAGPARTARVMTRNLYLGADLTPILQALVSGDEAATVGAATRTWAAVQATRPEDRMAAIADEIVAAHADVVGLQEVTRWTTYTYDPVNRVASNPVVAYDFLQLLLDALAARGVSYHAVTRAIADNFTSPAIPVLAGQALPTQAVQLADRDVILVRDGVARSHARTGTYTHILSIPVAGQELPVARGWGSVDVRVRHATFRFVNSHLEAFGLPGLGGEAIRVAQVGELLAAQDALAARLGKRPMVYVGDYNSHAPDAAAYSLLLAGVGRDAWVAHHRRDPGNTCCFDATLTDPTEPLTSRIDLVLTTPGVRAPRATVVGDELGERTASGLWPSDHAGVVARLVFPARH